MSVEQGKALLGCRMCDWPKEAESESEGRGEGRGSGRPQKRGSSEARKTKTNPTTIRTSLVLEALYVASDHGIVAGLASRVAGVEPARAPCKRVSE